MDSPEYDPQTKVQVFSIFHSISGEINIWPQGTPVVFIRLSGCNLKCSYCDTPDSQSITAGNEMTVASVVAKVKLLGCGRVIVTGGEPLNQNGTQDLLRALKAKSCTVAVETNGSISLGSIYHDADLWVMDYKLSSSRMVGHMIPVSEYSGYKIRMKFVCCDEQDVAEAAELLKKLSLSKRAALSAANPLTPDQLWELMLKYNLVNCILNLQIHKYIWPLSTEER